MRLYRSADLSRIKPKHFAAAFLGIEPQKARLRISLLQHPAVAPDLAKQARVGRQVATCIVDDPAYDRNTVGTTVKSERGLVATFGRQRRHAWGVHIRRIGKDQIVTRAADWAEQVAFMERNPLFKAVHGDIARRDCKRVRRNID